MLGLGGFPPLCKTTHLHHLHHTISQFFPFSDHTHLPFPSNCLTHQKFYPIRSQIRAKFCVFGLKNRSKEGNDSSLLELEGFDDFLDEDEDEEEEEDDDDEEEDVEDEDSDEEEFVPLKNMKLWLANKPSGFGQGKAYDTSVEDKLLEEMERSRAAQLANLNKLKNSPETANSKKEAPQKQTAPDVVPIGFRVRLVNLPKKKNIHKDLKLAFKGYPGILNISPAVIGNKKTRDPVCKGYAFVDFMSQDDANRFAKAYSGQSISFGKIQKEITCDIVNSKSPNPEITLPRIKSAALPRLPDAREDLVSGPGTAVTVTNSEDASASEDEESSDDDGSPSHLENVSEILTSPLENSVSHSMETTVEITPVDSLPSKKQEKVQVKKKKPVGKRKATKVKKLSIPGSANRLKVKEKAVLTDVFTKYAMQSASSSKRGS